jgi:peptide/nickel transport system permease protein
MGRKEFIVRRIISAVIIIFTTTSLLFFLFRMMPGDPTALYLDPSLSAEDRQNMVEYFGLDKPVGAQYILYMKGMFSGNFGRSFYYNIPALQVLRDKIWNTLILSGVSFVVAYSFGILMGVSLTRLRGEIAERSVLVVSFLVRATPTFWVGIVTIMLFSFRLGWFPHSGMHTPGIIPSGFLAKYISADFLRHLVLPVLVSSIYYFSFPMLVLRNSMLEIQGEDFIELARAKGLSTRSVLFKHVMRNAMLPLVTIMSVYVGMSLSGAAALEYVFSWPGLGNELLLSIKRADYPVAQAAFFILSVSMVVMNFIADMLYGYLDPRVVYN